MTPQDKERIQAELENGRQALLSAVRGIAGDVAGQVPAPGKWSALECVEHVALSEDFLLSQIAAGRRLETTVGSPEREARIVAAGSNRTRAVPSPEAARPTGRFSTLEEALQSFQTARERTIRLVEDCVEDLRLRTSSHPLVGPVNCYELLLMIAIHPHRHAKQIEEIKAALRDNG